MEDDLSVSVASVGQLQSPLRDGTIEEDFEAALSKEATVGGGGKGPGSGAGGAKSGSGLIGDGASDFSSASPVVMEEDFSDVSAHGIVEVVGDDAAGRKIIVVSACRLPSNKNFDHQRFLK